MRILFYYPSNKRTISIETLIRELLKQNHQISLLTICEKGDLHQELEKMGVKTYTHLISKTNTVSYHFKQTRYLASFCKEHNIDKVFSHLQQVNIIAVFAQYFMRAKIIIFRHHDYARNKKEGMADSIINRLAPLVVVPSSGVEKLMLKNEKINTSKLLIIPYIYDFEQYKRPDFIKVNDIKQTFTCQLLLIMVSRLVPQKRHYMTFSVINQLVKEGYNIKMMVMDTGSEQEILESYIRDNQLEHHIYLLGFKTNIIDYIDAADVLVHPSVSEASCSAVKEAGLLEKLVIVCKSVGDFDDYIVDRENGFLLDEKQAQKQLYSILKEIYQNKKSLNSLGQQLKLSVIKRFSPSNTIMDQYNKVLIS